FQEAVEFWNAALSIYEEIQDAVGQANTINNIGNVYRLFDNYGEALDFYRRSLAIAQALNDADLASMTLNNIGNVYGLLGDYGEALNYYQLSLDAEQAAADNVGVANTLNNIGNIYRLLEDYDQSLRYYEQSLVLRQSTKDSIGEANTLNNIGNIYRLLENYTEALRYYDQSMAIKRSLNDKPGAAITLGNIGNIYGALNHYDEALSHYHQSLMLMYETGDRSGAAAILGNIGTIHRAKGESILAILFLKQAVNQYESIRQDNQVFSLDLQNTYVKTVADTYHLLAELLLQQDRVLEAQRVLDLLKVQELQDYLQNVRGNARTASGVDFYQPEQAILTRYGSLQLSAIEVGQQLAQLNRKDQEEGLTPAETEQRNSLYQIQKEIQLQFAAFADDAAIQPFLDQLSRGESPLPLDEINGLRNNLGVLNAVLIYPLVLADRIELVITTPNSAPLRRTVENVTRAQLNETIERFRTALNNPYANAKAPAYQLYRWLIEPLEADLADAHPDTILYAPDGPLRYVPLAALYDSADSDNGQWLIERFKVNNITATSLQDINAQPSSEPRILAGAFADQNIIHTVPVGNRTFSFKGLPFAGVEVSTLADTLTNTRIFLDDAFSLPALEPQLNNFNILHFATHAALVPEDAGHSFILFGSGDYPTIKDIEAWPLYNVELVVLSACETGLGGFDNNGIQILGLGYQIHKAGAKAVIASLWQVSDGGTQALMNAFYLALSNGYPKAEALQRAQQALIHDDLSFVGGPNVPIQVTEVLQGSTHHPYYWAPFILIGNGL
ncbi:MAG: CHAT domain-containing protein, partial [Cyanobacteria bacterium J06627_15]